MHAVYKLPELSCHSTLYVSADAHVGINGLKSLIVSFDQDHRDGKVRLPFPRQNLETTFSYTVHGTQPRTPWLETLEWADR